jgi:EmrB/QacA subfamily drug resistance transporter
VFCGVAGDLTTMICFRILQGIPGGVIPVTSLTILYRLVPPWKLGAAMGLYGFGIVIAPGLGPALGGYLVEYVDWRLIFFINVPIGIIGVTAAILVLPDIPATPGRRFDLLGFGCVATGTFSLLLAVSEGQTWGWTGYRVLILLVLAALSLALFVVIELEVDEPLLDVRVFTHWPFINSLILVCVLSMGFYAVLFYVPLFLQEGQDITPMNTGLTVLPQAMVMAAIMPFAGNIYDRFGARWPAVIGLTLNAAGTLLLTGINVDATRPELIVWTMLRAGGMGLAVMPIMTSGLSVLPASMTSAGSAFNTLIQRVTSALGLAAMTGLVTAQQAQLTAARSVLMPGAGPGLNPRETVMQQHGPSGLLPLWQHLQLIVQAQTYSDVFMISGIASAIGAFLAFFISSERSASDGPREAVEIG